MLILAFLFTVLTTEVVGDKIDRYNHCKDEDFQSKLCNSSEKLNKDIIKFGLDK